MVQRADRSGSLTLGNRVSWQTEGVQLWGIQGQRTLGSPVPPCCGCLGTQDSRVLGLDFTHFWPHSTKGGLFLGLWTNN